MSPAAFRAALDAVAPAERDAWLDRQLGTATIPADEPLPAQCVPYLPCSVDAVLRAIDRAAITADDTFVDVGAGIGRVAALVHLATGAQAIGLEIQPRLAAAARRLPITVVEGDAANGVPRGSVYFLYCPFSGARLAAVLAQLEAMRPIRLCTVDLPLPACTWLARVHDDGDLAVYRG